MIAGANALTQMIIETAVSHFYHNDVGDEPVQGLLGLGSCSYIRGKGQNRDRRPWSH